MNIQELENLKADLERDHKAHVAAIDRILSNTNRSTAPSNYLPAPRLGKSVEAIIKSYQGKFRIDDICRKYEEQTGKLANRNVRSEIRNCLNKWKHRNPPEIVELTRGTGRRSGVYEYKAV